jgi:UDP-3-O-[3-hydroxymyristoyl] N-acetylglucosamine deacetylase
VVDTSRSTTIAKNGVKIHTIEHVMAALMSYQIDNLIIRLSNVEPPIGNGGSDHFVQMIEEAGIEEQSQEIFTQVIDRPLYFQKDAISLVALPYNGYKISYTLHYPGIAPIESQFHELELNAISFKQEIAPCRTFSLYSEVSYLLDKGLIRGASLANGVVVCEKAILSKEGLKFKNEMARHKILDLVGDLGLVGKPFLGHIIAIRSGHATNVAFAKVLSDTFNQKDLGC